MKLQARNRTGVAVCLSMILVAGFRAQANPDVSIKHNIRDPKKTVILLDLDDTVVQKSPYKGYVTKNVDAILYCLIRHPVTFVQKVNTKACSEEWQESFKRLSNKTDSYEHRFARIIQRISQEKQIIPGMQELLQKLYTLGYELQALTNMGEKDYSYLEDKYPDLFKLFSNVTYVTYDQNKKTIKKPMPEYFVKFIESEKRSNKNPNNKTYLFIDDNRENCQIAQKVVGFDYIKVPGNKSNAAFLTHTLQQYGIML